MNNFEEEEQIFHISGVTVSSGTAVFRITFQKDVSAEEKEKIKAVALARATLKLERDGHLEVPDGYEGQSALATLWTKAMKAGDAVYTEQENGSVDIKVDSIPAILEKYSSK